MVPLTVYHSSGKPDIMRMMRSARLLCALSIVLLFVAGCSKKESGTTARNGSAPNAQGTSGSAARTGAAEGSAKGAGTIRLNPVSRNGGAGFAQQPKVNENASTTVSGSDQLLAMQGGRSVYPSDFDIGALQPAMPAGTAQGAILQSVDQFFSELANGKVDEAVLSPKWKDDIVRLLSYPVQQGELPDSVRVGRITIVQEKAHAAIRMERGKGRADGEVYLERVNGRWLISDLQADFGKLMVPFVRAQAFDPAEWKSLMKE